MLTNSKKSTLKVFYGDQDDKKKKELSVKLLPIVNGFTRNQIQSAFNYTLESLDLCHVIKTQP